MKRTVIKYKKIKFLILSFLIFNSIEITAQSTLQNIEEKVLQAMDKSIETQTDQFQSIIEKLNAEYVKEKKDIINYWIGFTKYRQALFFLKIENDEQAAKVLNSGIEQLKVIKTLTSEDLSLQGTMVSLSIALKPDLAAVLSGEASSLYDKAIKLNDKNLRAYLGIGRSDYYRPKKYGGGYKVESYLKQALSMSDSNSDTSYAPKWGRDEVYYYLASFYHREGKLDEAKLYCNKGLKLKRSYNHYRLMSLKEKLYKQ